MKKIVILAIIIGLAVSCDNKEKSYIVIDIFGDVKEHGVTCSGELIKFYQANEDLKNLAREIESLRRQKEEGKEVLIEQGIQIAKGHFKKWTEAKKIKMTSEEWEQLMNL